MVELEAAACAAVGAVPAVAAFGFANALATLAAELANCG
jgi:hypothetical protein